MRRLRPVLWELGIASIVINVMALATPLFLMTVYNAVCVHPWQYYPVRYGAEL
jgi:ABC-type bacteriocin/lantibiotic exporter with double-glycine peptidase domain